MADILKLTVSKEQTVDGLIAYLKKSSWGQKYTSDELNQLASQIHNNSLQPGNTIYINADNIDGNNILGIGVSKSETLAQKIASAQVLANKNKYLNVNNSINNMPIGDNIPSVSQAALDKTIRQTAFKEIGRLSGDSPHVFSSVEDLLDKGLFGTESDAAATAIKKAYNDYCANGNLGMNCVKAEWNAKEHCYDLMFGCSPEGRGGQTAKFVPGVPNSGGIHGRTEEFAIGEDIKVSTTPSELNSRGAGVGSTKNVEKIVAKDPDSKVKDVIKTPDNDSATALPADNTAGSNGNTSSETTEDSITQAEGNTDPASPFINWVTSTKGVLISAAVVGGIIAGIVALSNTIKARFRKTAKTLYRLQKSFMTDPNGSDMDNAFKGVGSRITDVLVKMFGAGKKGRGMGIVPLIKDYTEEIDGDFKVAQQSFSAVIAASKNTNQEKNEAYEVSSDEPIYNSLTEAYDSVNLNHGNLNESLVAGLAMSVAVPIVRAGVGKLIVIIRDKNGKPVAQKQVAVTPQSTREVCYSIMTVFFNKYFNMEKVMKSMDMDVESLSDLNQSSVQKLKKLAEGLKAEQSDNTKVSKMFVRVKTRYDQMVKRYFIIADKLVKNFEIYSIKKKGGNSELSEKDSNLITASAQKLGNELDKQRDLFENNFFRVVNCIVSSEPYIKYIDFIVKDIIPVFETGLAGESDFVLNILPKKGEYYIVRQTGYNTLGRKQSSNESLTEEETHAIDEAGKDTNNQSTNKYEYVDLSTHLDAKNGVCAIVKIEDITPGDNGKTNITFKKLGAIYKKKQSDATRKQGANRLEHAHIAQESDGTVDFSKISKNVITFDKKAYVKDINGDPNDVETTTLSMEQWLALDPVLGYNYEKFDETPDPIAPEVYVANNQNGKKTTCIIYLDNVKEGEDIEVEYSPDDAVNEGIPVREADTTGGAKGRFKDRRIEILDDRIYGDKKDTENNQPPKDDQNAAVADPKQNTPDKDNQKAAVADPKQNTPDKDNQKAAVADPKVNNPGVHSTKTPNISFKTDAPIQIITPDASSNMVCYNVYLGDGVDVKAVQELIKTTNTPKFTEVEKGNINKELSSCKRGVVNVKDITVKSIDELKKLINSSATSTTPVAQTTSNNSTPAAPSTDTSNKTPNESIIIKYESPLKESLTSIKLNRIIESSKVSNTYLISSTAWGDGSIINPSKALTESINNILNTSKDYYDIASIAKRNKNIKISPLAESEVYNVSAPVNRHAMLTEGNPLYEAVAVIKVDNTLDKNIISCKFLGVNKIVK